MRAAAIIALGICLSGCAQFAFLTSTAPKKPAPLLPSAHTIVRDQLVICSNFQLPAHHRLLDEIVLERSDLGSKLGLPLSDEPIHVYLFETAEEFHQFLHVKFPQFPDRRAFFVETDTQLAVFAYWGDRVAEDLRHEVAHGYLHSIVPNLPLWLDEGLAKYYEVPRGRHGVNRPHLDELVDLQKQGKWHPDLRRLEALGSSGDMTVFDYSEAWAIVHMLLETTPERRQLLHDYLLSLRHDGAAEPLSQFLKRSSIEVEPALVEYIAWLGQQPN